MTTKTLKKKTNPVAVVEAVSEIDLPKALAANLDGNFARLVTCFQDRLYGFALRWLGNRQDAEEVVQDVFVRAYRALQGYQKEQIATLSIKAWLYQITLNLSRNKVRGKRLQLVALNSPDNTIEYDPPDDDKYRPEVLFEQNETSHELSLLMASLPERYRVAVTLRHVAGLDYNEMAQVLGQPLGTIKANVHRGVKTLRAAFEQSEQSKGRVN